MIFSLAQDFHDAVAAMPTGHPKHRMLELLEEAMRRDIHFIGRHPTTLFQCMWNGSIVECGSASAPVYPLLRRDRVGNAECRRQEQGSDSPEQRVGAERSTSRVQQPGFREFFEVWRRDREGCPYWLQANAPLPGLGVNLRRVVEFSNPSPIQAFCARAGLLTVASPSGAAETYAVPPGISLFSRRLNGGRVAALAMTPLSDVLAYRDTDGVIGVEGSRATLQGRAGETPLLVRSNGSVVAVDAQNALVVWFPIGGRCERLAENVPFPLRVLRDSEDGGAIFFVAGATEQQVGIVAPADSTPRTRIAAHTGPEIIEGDIDWERGYIALLLKNRSIRVTDLSMTEVVAEVSYQKEHCELVGGPLRCVLNGDAVYFVTSFGRVGRWNWKTSALDHVANCFEKTEHHPIAVFDVLDREAGLLISLPTHAVALDFTQLYETTVKHDGRPTQCIVTTGHDALVSVSEDENMIRWFSLGLAPLGRHVWPRPTCAAFIETAGEVIAGNRSGFVLHLPLSGTSGPVREYRASSRPIVGIVPRGRRGCVAIDADGRCSALEGGQPTPIASAARSSFRSQLKAFSTGASDDVWSLYESGNTWTLAHLDGDNEEHVVATLRQRIWDASVSPNGQRVCIAGDGLVLYERRHGTWSDLVHTREIARLVAFVGDEHLAVVLHDRNVGVEIRSIGRDLAPVATVELGHRVLCMGTSGSLLAVGVESGHLVSMSFCGLSQGIGNHGGDWQ